MRMSDQQRDEWLRLMLELAATDRDAYRIVRAETWEAVARSHGRKSEAEREEWLQNAS